MIELQVNSEVCQVDCEDSTPLLVTLRETLGLSGPRFGCGQGECGACMVLIDGKPETSCNRPMGSLQGCRVETIEGLGNIESPHPVQRAFLVERAGQCGYCLSGVLTSVIGLLRANPSPSRAEIIAALDPHLCRCGAYIRMIRAVERAVGQSEN